MGIKKIINYSPNFDPKKRKVEKIKFLIFHYTGMKKEKDAIKRLTDIKSKVSSHYLIKKNGELNVLVPDLYIAWHSGKSSWKKLKFLNRYSIGIEISNPGHDFKYNKFSNEQVKAIIKLSKFLIKKYKIKPQNILGHSDIAPDRKKDPGEKFPWMLLSKKKVGLWHSINKNTLKKNREVKLNFQNKKIFFNNLFKIGYMNDDKKNKNIKHLNLLVKAFQRRFRQELIDGKIDRECLIISNNLIKKFN